MTCSQQATRLVWTREHNGSVVKPTETSVPSASTGLLTVLLAKPTDLEAKPVKKLPDVYGSQRFITVLTKAGHLPLSGTRRQQIHTPTDLAYFGPTSLLSSDLRSLPLQVLRLKFLYISHVIRVLHSPPIWSSQTQYGTDTWRRVQSRNQLSLPAI
jgi:hypothetical protein